MDVSGSLHFLAKKLYRSLPTQLRVFANPAASWYDKLWRLRPQVWCITGEERNSHLPLTICLYTVTKQYKSYLVDLIFGTSFRERCLGRVWVWNAFKRLPKGLDGCSVTIVETHQSHLKHWKAKRGVVIPAWITGEADLAPDPRMIRRKSVRSDARNIEKNSLQCEITHDAKRFEDFYYNMYVPHLKKTHGNAAFLLPLERLRARLEEGDLVLVTKQGEPIAGILLTYEKGCPHLRHLGVRDGNRQLVREGATAAAYEFAFRHLRQNGYTRVRLGRSRAFLQDGALQFKKKRSHTIVAISTHKFVLQVLSHTDATRAFLQNNPFIFEENGNLRGAVFVGAEKLLTPKLLRAMFDKYFHIGLSHLVVLSLSGGDAGRSADHSDSGGSKSQTDPEQRFRCQALPPAALGDLNRQFGCVGEAIAVCPEGSGQTHYSKH